jgi:hypothetical protein
MCCSRAASCGVLLRRSEAADQIVADPRSEVGVPHGHDDAAVAEPLLDLAHWDPTHDRVGREGVPQHVVVDVAHVERRGDPQSAASSNPVDSASTSTRSTPSRWSRPTRERPSVSNRGSGSSSTMTRPCPTSGLAWVALCGRGVRREQRGSRRWPRCCGIHSTGELGLDNVAEFMATYGQRLPRNLHEIIELTDHLLEVSSINYDPNRLERLSKQTGATFITLVPDSTWHPLDDERRRPQRAVSLSGGMSGLNMHGDQATVLSKAYWS